MRVQLLAYTQQNPALTPEVVAGRSDLATLWQGRGAFPEQMIEYAGRVCYRSTHRMGTAPEFIAARVREGHEDIIEHVVITFRFDDTDLPLRWRILNRHCEVTEIAPGADLAAVSNGAGSPARGSSWIVSGNTRVWLDLLRRDAVREAVGEQILPILFAIAPKVYAEFAGAVADAPPVDLTLPPHSVSNLDDLRPTQDGPMRVTLLGYTQPQFDDPVLQTDHGSATFLFEGISRTCTHQLVRHRLASFSQESQRYVDLNKGG